MERRQKKPVGHKSQAGRKLRQELCKTGRTRTDRQDGYMTKQDTLVGRTYSPA